MDISGSMSPHIWIRRYKFYNVFQRISYIGLPEINTFSLDFKEELLLFAQEKSNAAEIEGNYRVKENMIG